jgi:hypothetical protein
MSNQQFDQLHRGLIHAGDSSEVECWLVTVWIKFVDDICLSMFEYIFNPFDGLCLAFVAAVDGLDEISELLFYAIL